MRTVATPTFDTVVEAISWLGELGFSHDFGRDITRTDALIAENNDFTLDFIIRFEGRPILPMKEHCAKCLWCLRGYSFTGYGKPDA